MKVEVNISLKEGVLDPEGQAIDNTLRNLGYSNFHNIRTGKQIILNIDKTNENATELKFDEVQYRNDVKILSVLASYNPQDIQKREDATKSSRKQLFKKLTDVNCLLFKFTFVVAPVYGTSPLISLPPTET